MSNKILNYIQKDPISYAHIFELLDRNYSIIFESEEGFIIKDEDVGFIYMSFNDKEIMKRELTKKRYEHYISYDKEVVDFYNDSNKTIELYQFVYTSKNTFDVSGYDIRVLSTDYADYIDSFYKPIGPGETSFDALNKKNVLGLFENGVLAGIIGRHPEGCVGMLHIFENYRRKGYAEILEKSMINKLLKENQKVFCEVKADNSISNHLQTKLGMIKGNKSLYWLV